jgi:hypothetical protein
MKLITQHSKKNKKLKNKPQGAWSITNTTESKLRKTNTEISEQNKI